MGQKLAYQRVFSEGLPENGGKLQGSVEFNSALSRYTYYQIGGPAAVIATPKSLEDLRWISEKIAELKMPFFTLGWGSNILFPDDGFHGVVIRMKFLGTQITVAEDGVLELGGSVGGSSLLRKASSEGWSGLAHLTGIPGSVGGMVAMNAGTHLGEFKDCALKVETVRIGEGKFNLAVRSLKPEDFSYRRSHFLNPHDLITRAWVKYTPTDPQTVKAQIDELYQRRKSTQPVDIPSCGSVFMNPRDQKSAEGMHAWQVIDKLGLRGHRIGNAQISEKHSNFIVNLGGAQAHDVRALITLAKTRAKDELGIYLHEEVKIL
ncbi:MAG: UDP-N-acetylmuramate dehydrogenase [Bdellovibrionales bacterium]|nr:UDP-N-acetylmuramate dehydrogenase [Bdellovibrionales bacterium]